MKLWLHYELAFHPAVAEPATIAAMEGVSPRHARNKLHYGRNSFFELEAVFIRTEDEVWIAFLVRSIRVEIDLEAVRPVESGNPHLHQLYPDRRWTELVLLCRHLNDLYFLVRLRSIQLFGEAGRERNSTQHKQESNS
jgi:hypothetical protein